MATPRSDDETQIETQEYESLRQQKTLSFAGEEVARSESVEASENPHTTEPVAPDVEVTAQPKKRRKEKDETEREPGSTLFPLSRVQKIIKADWAMPIVAKEATFLISIATEEFIKRLVEACYVASQKEKRATIQHKDLVAVTRKADEFLFLEGKLPSLPMFLKIHAIIRRRCAVANRRGSSS
ncbi:hypothetical protein BDN70DRAFT_870785 [Pholiota conissans]|uniref:Transcription factor CBF/NF-Y/archaeal histone domain-containing protein n=1 Tax=Pholiota conissans TaxID=109636 RepID=A0A9P6D032_9AGAR|nr:hypothetical protein BDN70DRAFT_870785 [Pholiota conissans]